MKKTCIRLISAILCMIFLIISILPQVFAQTNVVDTENSLGLTAQSALLMDADTGNVLYEYKADERHGPASVTKIMTLLLILEALERGEFTLDDIVTASAEAANMGGSQIYLKEGEQMSVRDMIKSIVVASANDAAYAMGEFVAGSNDAFVSRMNERAKELGMSNTNFVNVHGLDAEGHYTTARDIAIMSRELISHEIIYEYTSIWMDSIRDGEFNLSSTNKLLKSYDGITGLKTGSTSKSLFSMSATAKRDGVNLIGVVMAAPTGNDRFSDAAKLLDYGFANYSRFNVTKDETSFNPILVKNGQEDFLPLSIAADTGILISKSDAERIESKIALPETIDAPISKGEQVGLMIYTLDNETIMEVPIIATKTIDKIDMKFSIFILLQNLFTFLWN